jgi:hypothetical protein
VETPKTTVDILLRLVINIIAAFSAAAALSLSTAAAFSAAALLRCAVARATVVAASAPPSLA